MIFLITNLPIRQTLVFLMTIFIGLLINSTFIHTTFPSASAPDFILILTVAIAFFYHNVFGVCAAFLLGVIADFSSALYVGPNAAGCVIAFGLVGLIANRIYAEKVFAVFIITLLCALAKSLVVLFMLSIYSKVEIDPAEVVRLIGWEALTTAIVAPLVIRLLRGKGLPAQSRVTSIKIAQNQSLRWTA